MRLESIAFSCEEDDCNFEMNDVLGVVDSHWLEKVRSDHFILRVLPLEEAECIWESKAEIALVELCHSFGYFCGHLCLSSDCPGWSASPQKNEVDTLVYSLVSVTSSWL